MAIFISGTGYVVNPSPLPISEGGTGQTTAPLAINALLPSQTGQSGKFLTTDGSNVSWQISSGVATDIPLSGTTSGTIPLSDLGKAIPATAGVTVPASVFSGGNVVAVYNDTASPITITQGSGLTMRLVGSALTGNRTLAARGWATIWFRSATECIASGGGVS